MRLKVASLLLIICIALAGALSGKVPQFRFINDAAAWAITPVQEIVGAPGGGIAAFFDAFGAAGDLRQENARLLEEVARLRQESVRVTELEREVEQLRQVQELKAAFPTFQYVEAAVVAYDPSNLVRAFTINRGATDGVREGMTVVTPGGLVGRVVEVSQRVAKVLLITDTSNSVTAIVQGSRAHGVVNGERTEYLRMRYISQSETIRSGDKVITSGLGGLYPPGILIGTISNISKKDTDIFQEAQVELALDFGTIENVLVIVNHVPVELEEN